MSIKVESLFKMNYKELKEEPKEPKEPTRHCIAYAEIISTLVMTAMMCGTLLLTTQMWVNERQEELGYLRANP